MCRRCCVVEGRLISAASQTTTMHGQPHLRDTTFFTNSSSASRPSSPAAWRMAASKAGSRCGSESELVNQAASQLGSHAALLLWTSCDAHCHPRTWRSGSTPGKMSASRPQKTSRSWARIFGRLKSLQERRSDTKSVEGGGSQFEMSSCVRRKTCSAARRQRQHNPAWHSHRSARNSTSCSSCPSCERSRPPATTSTDCRKAAQGAGQLVAGV